MGALASPRFLPQNDAGSLPSSQPIQLGPLQLTPARSGDHLAIHQLLMQVFRGPSTAEFQLQQDEPGYAPAHRFVVRDGQRIVAHARVSFRGMYVGGEFVPIARLFDLCVLPEFRDQAIATHLLLACERLAREQKVTLLQTRSLRPGLFERLGWFSCGRHCYSLAGPREILAEMERRRWEQAAQHQPSDDLPQLARTRHPLTVRRWKQTEHAAVQRLYCEGIAELNGPLARSDDYWRWLITRQAFDWFYVVIDGPDRTLFDDIQGHIVGYMFLKGNRIVELMSSAASPLAAEALLARACRDAIEQSATPLRLDAPLNHPLHDLVVSAGGKRVARESDAGETWLAKVLDLPKLAAAALSHEAAANAHGAPAPRVTLQLRDEVATLPLQRAAATPSEPLRLALESGQLVPDHGATRPQIHCSAALLAQLLLGHTSLADVLELSHLRASNGQAREALGQHIASRTLWFSPLEDLLA